jgi:hypothetical protein
MATLVADGASPTQAHVSASNSALAAFETALTAYNAAVATVDVDIAVAKQAAGAAANADLGINAVDGSLPLVD